MVWMSGASLYIRNHDATLSYQDTVEINFRASRLAFTTDDGELVLLIPERSVSEERHLQFFTLDAEVERARSALARRSGGVRGMELYNAFGNKLVSIIKISR